jgi:hypothetical protein
MTSYIRASTIAKTLEDTMMLDKWSKRMMLIGINRSTIAEKDLYQLIHAYIGQGGDLGTAVKDLRAPLDELAELAQHKAGSSYASEFGTGVHAWCEWIDLQLGHIRNVPDIFRPWVKSHRKSLAFNGLAVEPAWTERIVLNTTYGIAGTLDRIFRDVSGALLLGDVKTSRNMDYSWLAFCIQLAIYHSSSHALSPDGTAWEPMPALDPDTALIAHLPREDPLGAHIVPVNMTFGMKCLHTAMTVREHRAHAEQHAQNVRYDVDSMRDSRLHLARYLIEISESEKELYRIWDEYQDIWTDDLTEMGRNTLRLADAK